MLKSRLSRGWPAWPWHGPGSLPAADGWLSWRGPNQNGNSPEKNLPATLGADNLLWTADFPGMSTPVIANGRLYIMGYLGQGPDLDEGVSCFDAETGKLLWQHLYADFLSDTIYLRYRNVQPDDRSRNGQRLYPGYAGSFRRLQRRRPEIVGTFHDGGIRAADLPQRPHGVAGGGQGFGHHARHHGQLGRQRPGLGPVLCF